MSSSETVSTPTQAKILIVDDHPAVREALGLRIARQANWHLCGEASGVADAMRLVEATDPDVVIVDISLKDGNGIELIKRITAHHDRTLVLVWSMHDPAVYAARALNAGARGYICKDQATEQIVHAIQQLLDGKVYLSGPIADRLLNRIADNRSAGGKLPCDALSDRELEAFQFMGQGLDTRSIAERMHVSTKTIETYRARIKDKLNLGSHTELIRRAVEWVLQRT